TRTPRQTTSAPATIQASVRKPPVGEGRSSGSDDSENTSRTASRMPWTNVPANESIAPDATAVGAESPWRWKNRMFTAMRARFEGSAPFMYPVAGCIAYPGPNGIDVGTEPSGASAWLTRGSCATRNANAIQLQEASPTAEPTSPQSTPPAAS